MAYILGYIAADGCLLKRSNRDKSWILNITSKDFAHLIKINQAMGSSYPVLKKYNSQKKLCFYISITNREVCEQLIKLGIYPKKTLILPPLNVPKKYFSHFVRGYFDADGSVYIYLVNNSPQLKSSIVSASELFIEMLTQDLSIALNIPIKPVYKYKAKDRHEMNQIVFYIEDSIKLSKFMYKNMSNLYLDRKYKIFQKWQTTKRRTYTKQNFLNPKAI